ncbi:MAG: phosphate ABC transporter permease subunit PstC [Bdellovibrionota bacterium]
MAVQKKRKEIHFGDRVFKSYLALSAYAVVALLVCIAVFVGIKAVPAFSRFGFAFFTTSTWDPVNETYGSLPTIFGTIVSSLIALIIAAPLSVAVALLITEVVPLKAATVITFLVQMLAAVPSVVYGLWGVFVLAPWLRSSVEPGLANALGFLPLFQGPAYGVGMLAAGIILAIMISPTICSICIEIFKSIPRPQREGAIALGATSWETIRISVLTASQTGIFGATILGLGRAIGETMAVTMVIGNRAEISASLFAPAQTMASVIANEYAEATSDLHLSALAAVGITLFIVTLTLNSLARLLVWRVTRATGSAS